MAAVKPSSIGPSPDSTRRMRAMRPRGDAASSPVTRNVGQCGRHIPHARTRPARRGRARASGGLPQSRFSTRRPGARRPVGVEGRLQALVDGRTAGSTGRGGCGTVAVDDADAELGDEADRAPSSGRASRCGDGERPPVRQPVGRTARRRRARGRATAAWASTSSAWPVEQHPRRRAVPQAPPPGGGARRQTSGPDGRGEPPLARPARGRVRSDHLGEQRERAERADEQPAEVVAGDVLDRRSARLHHRAVGRDGRDLQHRVADRAPPEAAYAAAADGEHAADGRRRRRAPGRATHCPAAAEGARRARRRSCRRAPAPSSRRAAWSTTPAGARTSRRPARPGRRRRTPIVLRRRRPDRRRRRRPPRRRPRRVVPAVTLRSPRRSGRHDALELAEPVVDRPAGLDEPRRSGGGERRRDPGRSHR